MDRFRTLLLLSLAAAFPACGDSLVDAKTALDITIEAVSPSEVPSRGGVEVTVIGDNFAPGAQVTVGGEPVLGLVLHGEQRLTFIAAPSAVGSKDLMVRNPSGQSAKRARALAFYAEQIRFAGTQRILAENQVRANLVVGDIDGDRRDDVVAQEFDGTVAPFLSRGGGQRLERGTPIVVDNNLSWGSSAKLADLDGDGMADLIVGGMLRLATGGGEFAAPVALPYAGVPAIADFDGDGVLEMGFFGASGALVRVEPNGTFNVVRTVEGVQHFSPFDLAAGDVNGDGAADVVYRGGTGSCLRVRLGPELSAATETSQCELPLKDYLAFEIRDVTGDGHPDVVAATDSRGTYVYVGQGDGSFAAPRLAGWLCSEQLLHPPLVAGSTDWAPMAVTCYPGVQLVGWQWGTPRVLTLPVTAVGIGDLDGNGAQDLITNDGGGFSVLYGPDYDPHPSVPLVADPREESRLDTFGMVRGAFGGGRVAAANWHRGIYSGGGDLAPVLALLAWDGATLAPTATLRLGEATPDWDTLERLIACDLDGDSDDDLVAVMTTIGEDGFQESYLQTVLVDESGMRAGERFAAQPNVNEGSLLGRRLLSGDLDGDGRCDLVWLPDQIGSGQRASTVWINRASGFEAQPLDVGRGIGALVDADGDGDLDLVALTGVDSSTPSMSATSLELLRNDGAGHFQSRALDLPLHAPLGQPALGLATDLRAVANADGGFDLWYLAGEDNGDSPSLSEGVTYLARARFDGQGAALTTSTTRLPQFGFSQSRLFELDLGDVNGDGVLDVMAAPIDTPRHVALVISGEGVLGTPITIDLAPEGERWDNSQYAAMVTLLDFDGDGLDDLVYRSRFRQGKLLQARNLSE